MCQHPYVISYAGTKVDLISCFEHFASLGLLIQCFHVDSFDIDGPIVVTKALINWKKFTCATKDLVI